MFLGSQPCPHPKGQGTSIPKIFVTYIRAQYEKQQPNFAW